MEPDLLKENMPFWENKSRMPDPSDRSRQGSRSTSLAFFIPHRPGLWLLAAGILLILLIIYGFTLAPGLSWANGGTDGGDLITAAATGGVPHPGGFPLYLLLARGFQLILPGDLAWRTNMLSAICTSLAAAILFFLSNRVSGRRAFSGLASWSAALAFGLAPLVWSQAVITEVYGLQALLTAVILFQATGEETKWNGNFLRGLTVGLAIGCHLISILLLPLLFWDGKAVCRDLKKHIGRRFIGVLAGLSVYLLLPVRALGHPPVNWGNPVTPQAFFDLVSGSIYRSNFTMVYSFERLRGLSGILIDQAGLIGLFLAVFFLAGNRVNFTRMIPFFWIFISHAIFTLVYGSFDSYVYLIPAVMVYLFWAAAGLQEIIEFCVARCRFAWFPVGLLIISLLIWHGSQTLPAVDASYDLRAEKFGQEAVRSLPRDALAFTADDESSFTLWYYHFALKQRPDIAVVVEGLLPYGWYQQTLEFTYPGLQFPTGEDWTAVAIAQANPQRPACSLAGHGATTITCSGRQNP